MAKSKILSSTPQAPQVVVLCAAALNAKATKLCARLRALGYQVAGPETAVVTRQNLANTSAQTIALFDESLASESPSIAVMIAARKRGDLACILMSEEPLARELVHCKELDGAGWRDAPPKKLVRDLQTWLRTPGRAKPAGIPRSVVIGGALALGLGGVGLGAATSRYWRPRLPRQPVSSLDALVIGVGAYRYWQPIPNAPKDARHIAKPLRHRHWNVVSMLQGSSADIRTALNTFKPKTPPADGNSFGFVYLAGHGIEVNNLPYFIGEDGIDSDTLVSTTTLETREDTARDAWVAIREVLPQLQANFRYLFITIDACRTSASRGATAQPLLRFGFDQARPSRPVAPQSFIFFSTNAGRSSPDGAGDGSLFGSTVARILRDPAADLDDLVTCTTSDVYYLSGLQQQPVIDGAQFNAALSGRA
ncbi:MAG: caspase family protein [Terricaulis sp.]